MKAATFIERSALRGRQRGDALLESLVGIVIASIMGLGLAYTASRMVASQVYVTTQNAVIDQMASALAVNGMSTLCAGTTQASVTVAGSTLTLPAPTCTNAAVTVTSSAGPPAVTLPAGVVTSMTLSTPSANTSASNMLGGNGVLTISE
jgi:prepilin peptidase dependent protein A